MQPVAFRKKYDYRLAHHASPSMRCLECSHAIPDGRTHGHCTHHLQDEPMPIQYHCVCDAFERFRGWPL